MGTGHTEQDRRGVSQPANSAPVSYQSASHQDCPAALITNPFIQSAILILVTFFLYRNSLAGGFHFDDQVLLLNHSALGKSSVLSQFLNYEMGRPVTLLSFRLNNAFGGNDPFSYHLLNVTIHCLNVALLYLLVYATLASNQGACSALLSFAPFVASLLFAVHPLHTQAVNYIWARSSLLATLFFLASLNASAAALQSKRAKGIFTALGITFYILALGSKPIAVTLPAILLIYDLLFVSRFVWSDLMRRWRLHAVGLVLTLIVIAKVLLSAEAKKYGVGFGIEGITPLVFFYTQLRVIVRYLALLIYPANLNLDYDFPIETSFISHPVLLAFVLHASLFLYAMLISRDKPLISFPILWFYVSLSPSSSFIPAVDVIFEHHAYLPSVGASFAVAAFVGTALRYRRPTVRGRLHTIATAVLCVCVVALSAVATVRRNAIWQNDVTLWKDTVKKSPNKARPHNNLGHALFASGSFTRAALEFEEALRIDPHYTDALLNRAACHIYFKQYDSATALIERSLTLRPHDSMAYYNLGLVSQERKTYDLAIRSYQRAIDLDPSFKQAHINLGVCYLAKGLLDSAVNPIQRALLLDSNDPLAHYNLAVIHARKGEADEALVHFQRAIKINPDSYEVRNDLGVFLLNRGLTREAAAQLARAIEIDPSRSQAHVNLGLCLANLGSYDEAINSYQKALLLDASSPALFFNLGNAYSLKGEFQKARDAFTQALRIDPRHTGALAKLEEVEEKLSRPAAETR